MAISGLVGLYQRYVSADYNRGNNSYCMFSPSCSSYMKEAIREEGLVAGTIDGLVRLYRCTPEVAQSKMREFAIQLVEKTEPELAEEMTFASPEARDKALNIKAMIDRNRGLVAAGRHEEGAALQQQWTTGLRDDLLVQVEDRPGMDRSAPTRFKVSERTPRRPSEFAQHRSALATAAGMVGGVAGAVVAALGMGVGEALVAGTTIGVAAGSGHTDRLNASLTRRYGPEAVLGLAPLERKLGTVGYRVHSWVKEKTGSSALAGMAGVAIGLPTALAVALWDGSTTGGRRGWEAGRIFGHNLVADALG